MLRTALLVLPILFLFLAGLVLGLPGFGHVWGVCPQGEAPGRFGTQLEFCPDSSILWGLNYC